MISSLTDPTPLPVPLAQKDDIEAILDDQIMSTRNGSVHCSLVCWGGRPASNSMWITSDVLQQLAPELLEFYRAALLRRVLLTLGEFVRTPEPKLNPCESTRAGVRR